MKMNVEKTFNENLKATITNTDIINKTQLESVEYFNCLSSVVTNGARFARDMKSGLVMAKNGIQQEDSFHQQVGLKFKEETSEVFRA